MCCIRFATFHLDRFDLSPITISDDGDGGTTRNVDVMHMMKLVQERVVPDWIEQARRLGGLLMGVSSQAARPISLAKEWESIAKKVRKTNHDSAQGARKKKKNTQQR